MMHLLPSLNTAQQLPPACRKFPISDPCDVTHPDANQPANRLMHNQQAHAQPTGVAAAARPLRSNSRGTQLGTAARWKLAITASSQSGSQQHTILWIILHLVTSHLIRFTPQILSDLCSECTAIDFTAVFTPPQDYKSEEKPWILVVEREQLARKLNKVGVWPFHMPRFAALSYRWGVTPEPQMEQDREGRFSNLPLTIEDAISVTKGLGLRYLWVNQYCIDQSNIKEKQEQIQKMDRIYQCAEVTILATAGDDCHYGLPGVSKRARQVLDPFILDDHLTFGTCPAAGAHWQNGAWHERGWTFQETHLARRRLIFSDTLVHFECSRHKPWQRENSGGFETVQHNAKETRKLREGYAALALDTRQALDTWDCCQVSPIISTVSLQKVAAYVHRGYFEACIMEYYSFVTHYTMRKLSYTSDALNAFLGLANAMQELRCPVYNVAGVPFMVGNKRTGRDYWAESTFSYGLAWYSRDGMDRSDQQVVANGGFPSWSWGNVKSWPVRLDLLGNLDMIGPATPRPPPKDPKNCHIKYDAQLRDIQVECTSDGKKQVIGLVKYAEMSGKDEPATTDGFAFQGALCAVSRHRSSL
ncbi:hypothetical protein LA080_001551 [Diaporthe eres]|nr:hypothetical protein LA080_001551 [Diaporthe eres]